MRRRGNKSSKVPNVKLRPADKGAYSTPVVESCWAQDTQSTPDDSRAGLDTCPRPLADVVICATGVTDKPTLFKQAVELGATCTPAFTDRVTHLIAEDHGGPKYICALERKIPIVKPSWITNNYQIWLKGDDVDVDQSVENHRLPVFAGVVVCPSGITDITRRTQISKMVAAHDGQYLKNLERPVRVTHLLCSGDEETDKMRYAEKFNARGEAKIHLVWEEWFWDSLDFGGRFDESKYQVRRPRPERKILPAGPPPSSSLPTIYPSQLDEGPSSSAPPKPAEDVDEEPAFANVLPDVTLQLWGNLLGRRGYQVTDGEIILSPSKAGPPPARAPPSPEKPAFGAARSVLSSFRRVNSFAPQETSTAAAARQLPFRRAATTNGVFTTAKAGPSRLPGSKDHAQAESAHIEAQIFSGMRVRAMGEAKGATVRSAIELRGGVIVADEDDDDVDFIIVRLVSGSKIYRDEEEEHTRAKFRTECWLEQCIYEDRICQADEQLAFVPLAIPTPVPGAERVIFSYSGFDQSESHGLNRLIRALGITLAPTFNKRTTHLLCPSATGLKFEKAHEWGVPVINMQWLAEMVSSGTIPSPRNFLVTGPVGDAVVSLPGIKENPVDKGKGRAIPQGGDSMQIQSKSKKGIVDITNDVDEPARSAPKKVAREATTIFPDVQEPQEGSRSTYSLGNRPTASSTYDSSAYYVHPSSIPTQSRPPSMPPMIEEPEETDDVPAFVPNKSLKMFQTAPRLEAERSNPNFRIPSSKSPSPLKVQAQAQMQMQVRAPGQMRRTTSRASLSPVKIDHEATKALQESITSLLGKRPSVEADEARAGTNKRARPQRSKAQSRQVSAADIGAAAGPSAVAEAHHPLEAPGVSAISAFESYEEQEESMRVLYEDPGQLKEKQRLMAMLKSQSVEDDSIVTSTSTFTRKTRRSTRISG